MSIKQRIKSYPALKNFVHWCLIPKYQAKPRYWVKLFINPFYHKKGKSVTICRNTRVDVFPFQPFTIGNYSTVEDFVTINNGVGAVHIGSNCRVGMSNVLIGPIIIGNNVILAQNIVISALNHNYENVDMPIYLQGETVSQITIEEDCWIGANVIVTAGVTIGKHSVIGGGAVVTKNIPAYCVAVGNPAKIIKKYNLSSKIWENL